MAFDSLEDGHQLAMLEYADRHSDGLDMLLPTPFTLHLTPYTPHP